MSPHQAALKNETLAPHASASTATLFTPYRLGDLALRNRLVMSPMTRSRALEGNVPNPLAEAYYRQRADAGLIITEATQVSPQGVGYSAPPAFTRQNRSRAGARSPPPWPARAARSSCNSGMSDAFRIQTFTTAHCRWLLRQ